MVSPSMKLGMRVLILPYSAGTAGGAAVRRSGAASSVAPLELLAAEGTPAVVATFLVVSPMKYSIPPYPPAPPTIVPLALQRSFYYHYYCPC